MGKVAGLRFTERYSELIGDQCNLIEQLRKEKEEAEKNYLDTLEKLKLSDIDLENIKKTIERYEKENKAFRELIALWI